MTVELGLIFAGLSVLCAFLGYQKGVKKDRTEEGQQQGRIGTDLEYLKNTQTDTLLEVKDLNRNMNSFNERLTRVEERSKSNTHRITRLEEEA